MLFRSQNASRGPARPAARAEVYLLRGLFNVFSLGMDDLGRKLQAQGHSVTVVNHASWMAVADGIIASRSTSGAAERPAGGARTARSSVSRLVLIGHSLGGNDVVKLAARLGQAGVPVDLLVPVDATAPDAVPGNVRRVFNIYQSNNGFGSPLRAGAGFAGQLVNADIASNRRDLDSGDLGHTSIDKSGRIHREIIGIVGQISQPPRRVAQRKPRGTLAAKPVSDPAAAPTTATGAAANPPPNAPLSNAPPSATGAISVQR